MAKGIANFTAKITGYDKRKKDCDVTVDYYKDGVYFDTHTMLNVTQRSSINTYIKNRIETYKNIDDFDDTLIGDVELVEDENEVIIKNFIELFQRELALQASFKAGSAKQPELDAAITARKEAYTNAPLELQPKLDNLMRIPF